MVAGEINDLADVDMFAVVIEKPCELTVMLASASDVVLELRDAAGVVVANPIAAARVLPKVCRTLPLSKAATSLP